MPSVELASSQLSSEHPFDRHYVVLFEEPLSPTDTDSCTGVLGHTHTLTLPLVISQEPSFVHISLL